jgi:flagellar basal body-associated protein FliL
MIVIVAAFKANYEVEKPKNNKKGCMRIVWLIIAVIVALVIIAFFGWYFLNGPTRPYEYTPHMKP